MFPFGPWLLASLLHAAEASEPVYLAPVRGYAIQVPLTKPTWADAECLRPFSLPHPWGDYVASVESSPPDTPGRAAVIGLLQAQVDAGPWRQHLEQATAELEGAPASPWTDYFRVVVGYFSNPPPDPEATTKQVEDLLAAYPDAPFGDVAIRFLPPDPNSRLVRRLFKQEPTAGTRSLATRFACDADALQAVTSKKLLQQIHHHLPEEAPNLRVSVWSQARVLHSPLAAELEPQVIDFAASLRLDPRCDRQLGNTHASTLCDALRARVATAAAQSITRPEWEAQTQQALMACQGQGPHPTLVFWDGEDWRMYGEGATPGSCVETVLRAQPEPDREARIGIW